MRPRPRQQPGLLGAYWRPGRDTPAPRCRTVFGSFREKELKQDRELKLSYATWLRRLLAAQLAIADLVFVAYAWAGREWHLDPAVIDIWLGATVVQVVGIVLVVTRHLFPQRDRVALSPKPESK
jgi:hypothetical protein